MDLFDLVAKITLDASEYEAGLGGASEKTESFGASLGSKLGTAAKGVVTGITAVTGAVTAAGGAVVAAASKTAEYGDSIDKASQKLGISSSAYQEWEAVLQHSGTSMSSMTASFKTLANASQDASDDQVAAFQRIGLSMQDVANMSTEDLWAATIAGLQNMEEGTERTAIATDLLGKGAMELGPLLNTSAEDTQAMIDKVNELGGVMSEDAVKASARFQDSLQDMQTGFSGLKNNLASELLPTLADFMDLVTENAPQITSVLGGALSTVIEGVVSAATTIAAHFDTIQAVVMTVVTTAAEVIGTAWGAIQVIFSALSEGITQITSSVSGTGDIWTTVWTAILEAITLAGDAIAAVITIICTAIAALVTEAQTDGTLINSVWEGIQTAVQVASDIISGVIATVIALLEGDFSGAWEALQALISTVWGGIKSVISAALSIVKTAISTTFTAIKTTAETIWDSIKEKISEVWEGIKSVISTALEVISSTVSGVWEAISSAIASVLESIRSTVSSVWEAIKLAISAALEAISSTVSSVWNAISSTISSVLNSISSTVSSVWNSISSTVSSVLNRISSTVSSIWSTIQSTVSDKINGARDAVASAVENIRSGISEKFNSAKSTVTSIFNDIKSGIEGKINGARDAVKTAIDKIKSFFNFSWSLPKLKLPHVSITGKFSIDPPSVPHFSVSWYKQGGVLLEPTIFGASGTTLLAGGEAGPEAIAPISVLQDYVSDAVTAALRALAGESKSVTEKININVYINGEDTSNARTMGRDIGMETARELRRRGYATV